MAHAKKKFENAPPVRDWSEPRPVTEVAMVFGDITGLMPSMEEIPEAFTRGWGEAATWVEFQSAWFFKGLDTKNMLPKIGISPSAALAHLQTIQSSFTPKHEHKKAAVAWLASLWFESWKAP